MNSLHNHPPVDEPRWLTTFRSRVNSGMAHAHIATGDIYDIIRYGRDFYRFGDLLETLLASNNPNRAVVRLSADRGLHAADLRSYDSLRKALADQMNNQTIATIIAGAAPSPTPSARVNASGDRALSIGMAILDGMLSSNQSIPLGIIIQYDDAFAARMHASPDILATLVKWGRNQDLGARDNIIVMLSETMSQAPEELRLASSRWYSFHVPMPSFEERLAYIDSVVPSTYQVTTTMPNAAIASVTGGLRLLDIEDLLVYASNEGRALTADVIATAKYEAIARQYDGLLRYQMPSATLADVGGYADLVQFLDGIIAKQWSSGNRNVKALLLSGPPGVGKTHLAEALAGSMGTPFVVFSPAGVLDSLVGHSERNFERALQAVLSIGSCVFFVDEVDQLMQRSLRGAGDGGSRVSAHLFARFLEFLESEDRVRNGVLVVMATNRPDQLDSALISRVGSSIPVLPPLAVDRRDILRKLCLARFGAAPPEDSLDQIARATGGWVGRDLKELLRVVASELHAHAMTATPDTLADMMAHALDVYAPTPRPDDERMIAAALAGVSDLRMLPESLRERVKAARKEKRQAMMSGLVGEETASAEMDALQAPPSATGRRSRSRM